MTELTRVGAHSVGVAAGAVFVAVAFLPKVLAVVLAMPGPVFAAYLGVLLATLFAIGMKMAVQDGLDYRKGLIVGVAFWIGVGFQNDVVFPEHVSELAGGLLRNGVTAGGLAVILMTLFVEMTKPRRSRIEAAFDLSVLPKVREFLRAFASRSGWDAAMAGRFSSLSWRPETRMSRIGLRCSATSPARRPPRRRCHSGCCADSRPRFAISRIVGWMW